MRDIADEVFELAWSLGGTISGEHADGLLRAAFIERQYGKEYYEVLRKVKDIFDPAGIMNPGKIINDDPDVMIKNLRTSNLVISERLDTNLLFSPDEFRFEIEQCNGDGVCISTQPGSRMCPVFRATGDELACSRAKANLLGAWITGLLKKGDIESPEFKKILSLCINCKMCSVECPSGVDISKLIIEARAEYVKHNGLTLTEFVLSHNRFLSILASAFAPLSSFTMKLPPFKWLLEKTVNIDRRRAMPAFERGSFVRKGQKYLAAQPPLKNPTDKVVYFVDSYAGYNDHELGFAVIKTLLHNNIEVVIPPQRPVPLPAIAYGDMKTVKKDLAYNIASLADFVDAGYKIVCSEPSAALCLEEDVRFFIDSDAGRAVSANTFELMSYLNSLYADGMLKTSADIETRSFAYHSPCHMCAMGLAGNSIELLNKLARAKITDINAGCCGLAGTCGMQKKNYDLSVKIGKEMTDAIAAMDTEYVLTECAACKMQIEQLTDKKVLHPIKILAHAYGLI
jgi:anaerobic glycerol-3-phosphate dehydrogenase C subunit